MKTFIIVTALLLAATCVLVALESELADLALGLAFVWVLFAKYGTKEDDR